MPVIKSLRLAERKGVRVLAVDEVKAEGYRSRTGAALSKSTVGRLLEG